jgi:hypothetical protein
VLGIARLLEPHGLFRGTFAGLDDQVLLVSGLFGAAGARM